MTTMGNLKAARARLRAARIALGENQQREEAAGIDYETPEFLRLNQAVADAEKDVPWWRDDLRAIPDRFRYRHDDGRPYRLYRDPKACDSDDWGRPYGRYETLPKAMAAAGLPDPARWETGRDCPDECFARSPLWWSILAPGAAAEAVALGARPGRSERMTPVPPSRRT